jgi:hypothetical protein
MNIDFLITALEFHLDVQGVTERSRRGCQYHEAQRVIQRGPAGWSVVDVEPRQNGGFVPSNAALGEVVEVAIRNLKQINAPSVTAGAERSELDDRNLPSEGKPAKR